MVRASQAALLGTLIMGALVYSQSVVGPVKGAISGSVVDNAGLPVADAVVEYHNFRNFVRDSDGHVRNAGPIIASTVKTDASGSFTISGLPVASYGVCAHGVLATDLGSCEWGAPGAVINVTAESVTGVLLKLATGALINVQVSDPKGRIAAGARFAVGVISPSGEYKRAKLLSSTTTGLTYQVVVPLDATMYLVVDTRLSITDQSGQPVATGTLGPRISLGTSAQTTVVLEVQ